MSFTPSDAMWMQKAHDLALTSLFITTPNPRVGCVLVRDQQLLGQGATQQAGGPHAEVCAIADAQQQGHTLKGATAYVTLEPCSHFGRTPPCCDALIKHEVARVVVAMRDPNPLVAGQGIERLRQAGIHVDVGLLGDQTLATNVGFISRMVQDRPWIWSKLACSLDGQIALANGQSQWITHEQARNDGQYWRARSCAVLTGIGTVRHDNPLLNVRSVCTPRQPIRAVIDRSFSIDPKVRLLNGDPVWVFIEDRSLTQEEKHKKAQLEEQGVTVIPMPLDLRHKHLDLVAIVNYLNLKQLNEIHVEAGPQLNTALLKAGLLDELLIYMAPKVLGKGQGMFEDLKLTDLANAPEFEFFETVPCGHDLRLRARNALRWQSLVDVLE